MTKDDATSEMRILSVEQLRFISDAAYQAGAAAEREACAEICKPQERWDDPLTAYEIAQAIRARS